MQSTNIKVGAGRATICFPENFLPVEGFIDFNDPLHVRIILIESNITLAIASYEATSFTGDIVIKLKELINQRTSIPIDNIFICATHTFSVPHFIPTHICKSEEDFQHNQALLSSFANATEKAIALALSSKTDACIGYNTGTCNINANRDILTKDGWWLGISETGPADKTVPVLRIDSRDGKPIAVLFTYSVQSSVMDGSETIKGGRLISSDLAGAACRFVEQSYKNQITAIFTMGTAGDQSPALKMKYTYVDKHGSHQTEDTHEQGTILAEVLGKRLGFEVLHVSESIETKDFFEAIQIKHDSANCPGQVIPQSIHTIQPTKEYEFIPTENRDEPFDIITIGDIAIVTVRPELSYQTAQEIKKNSPYPKTIIWTMVNGGAKYMADQNAYDRITYEAMNSYFARGSAEIFRDKILQSLKK